MKIQSPSDQLGAIGQKAYRTPATEADKNAQSSRESIHGDRLDISINSQLSLFSDPSKSADSTAVSPSAERLEGIRQRLANGYYLTDSILLETADRIKDFYLGDNQTA